MTMNFFETKQKQPAIKSMEQAQHIAFGPVIFQSARILRDSGILTEIENSKEGLTQEQVVDKVKLPVYGVRVLLEAGLGIGLLTCQNGVYKTTDVAYFILNDKLTRVNMDFIHDVCYNGLFYLEDSIKKGKPEGLKVFGDWPTVYDALAHLPKEVQKSWFAFDHYYSDFAFPDLLPLVFNRNPKTLMDIGGNTGKWAIQCFEHDKEVSVTIFDLPGQVDVARARIEERGFKDRITFYSGNVLDPNQLLPKGFDAIWMSQFLDCFSEEQIISILKKCAEALTDNGCIYILEPLWDRQRFPASAFSLQQTSLYFTAIANGNSQMYHSQNLIRCIEEAGFEIIEQKDQVGVSHTLLICKTKR
jgi:ubiquinone/menaquinone biosynthesis C-methylase UbiE